MERIFKHTTNPFLRGLKFLGFIILGAIAAAGFAFLFGYFVMMLWNWLIPELFGLATITFWQGAGIVLLARLIFGGFKHGPGCSTDKRSDFHKRKFFNKWREGNTKERRCGDWRHFDDYWNGEGEQAYNNYVERKNEQEQK